MAARPAAAKLYEYALRGMTETVWRDGDVVYKRRRASEKALIFLLSPRSDALRPPAAAAPATDTEGAPLDMLAETAALFDLFLDNLARPPAGGADEEEGEAGESGADTPPPEPDRG